MSIVETVALLSVVVLLPLIPAFLLYKYLPSKTIAEGPFKGLNVHLTGAFAGYFLTFITAGGMAQLWATSNLKEEIADSKERISELEEQLDRRVDLWNIRGEIWEGQNEPTAFREIGMADIRVVPPEPFREDGLETFEMKGVPISRKDLQSGEVKLVIKHPNYTTKWIHLKSGIESSNSERPTPVFPVEIPSGDSTRSAVISEPIIMRKIDENDDYEGGPNEGVQMMMAEPIDDEGPQ